MASKSKNKAMKLTAKSELNKKFVDPALLNETKQSATTDSYANSIKKQAMSKTTKVLDEDSGQSLSAASSQVKFTASEQNYYDLSGLKTNLFNATTNIASSSSNDSNNNNWQKYVWYSAGGLALIGTGVALANSGGGGSSPAPTPINSIDNFFDFCASSAFLSPTILKITSDGSYSYDLTNGFERPENFSSFNFNGLNYASSPSNLAVDADGLAIKFDTEDAVAHIDVSSDAYDEDSEVIWLHELSVTSTSENTGDARVDAEINAFASASSDAEIGICEFEVDLESENALSKAEITSWASWSSYANVFINDVTFNVKTSGSSYVGSSSDSSAYFSNGAYITKLNANASYGSEAQILIGNIHLTHESSGGFAQAGFITEANGEPYTILNTSASFGSTASLEIRGDIDINAINSASDAAYATGLGVNIFDNDDASDDASIRAFGFIASESHISVDGDFNVSATAEEGFARATLQQNNSLYLNSTDYVLEGGSDNFYAGIQAVAVGEDYANASATVSLGNINLDATAFSGTASADFAQGNSIDIDVVFGANAVGSESNAHVSIGDINLNATGEAAYASMVAPDDSYNNGYANSALLEFVAAAGDNGGNLYWDSNNNSAVLEVGDLSLNSTLLAEDGTAQSALVTGAWNNTIVVSSYLNDQSTESLATVTLGDISLEANSAYRDSEAKAFGVGGINGIADADGIGSIKASFNINASNDASEDNTSTVTVGNIDISANVADEDLTDIATTRNSDAHAFLAGGIDITLHNGFALFSSEVDLTRNDFTQYAEFNIKADTHQEGDASVLVGDISIEANTDGRDSVSQAYIAGDSTLSSNRLFTNDGNEALNADADWYVNNSATVSITADSYDESISNTSVGDISISAIASGKDSEATAFMAGLLNSEVHMVASEYVTATGDNVTGDVSVAAITDAYLDLNSTVNINFESSADEDSQSTLTIGNISIEARAESDLLSNNDATAFMAGFVRAYANAYADANATAIGGPGTEYATVDVTANANAIAEANVESYINVSISADAEESAHATTTVGDINIEAHAGKNGDALAFMAGFVTSTAYADADASRSATAGDTLNGTISEIDNAYANSYINVDITSSASDYATAETHVGDISIKAISSSGFGKVDAFMAGYAEGVSLDISAEASDDSTAIVTVGDISIYAEKTVGVGDVNAFMAGQSENLGIESGTGYAGFGSLETGYTNLTLYAEAEDDGVATVDIGNIEITSIADNGDAFAALALNNNRGYTEMDTYRSTNLNISAYASEDADATLSISSINVNAISNGDDAIAALALANDREDDTYNGDFYTDNTGQVSVEISAYATASDGDSATATLNIGDINISATAQGDALAYVAYGEDGSDSHIGAFAWEDATATVNIEQINISAHSEMDSAYAGFNDANSFTDFRLHAYAEGNGGPAEAYLNIDGIEVEAIGKENAFASIDDIEATAYDGGFASVEIGDISVTASSEGFDRAYIDNIYASATDYSDAEITLGNIVVSAGGLLADGADADLEIDAYASDYSNANITVGDISITARSEAHDDTQASLNIYAVASDYSLAEVTVGDINVASYGTVNSDWDFDSFARIYIEANAVYDSDQSNITTGNITLTTETNIETDGDTVLELDIYADQEDSANVTTGNINVNLLGTYGSEGDLDIGSDGNDYDQISIGNLIANIEDSNSDLYINIDKVDADQNRYASFKGDGDVFLDLDTEGDTGVAEFAFGKIYLTSQDYSYTDGNVSVNVNVNPENPGAEHNGDFHLSWGYNEGNSVTVDNNIFVAPYNDDLDDYVATGNLTFQANIGQPDLVPHTTIYGYNVDGGSSISFNGVTAINGQFYNVTDVSPKTEANDLWQSIADAMLSANDINSSDINNQWNDLDHVFVFDTFDETANMQDLNGDSYYSSNLGVLAYDQEIGGTEYFDGNDGSITALVFFNNLNGALTEENLSGIMPG